MNTCICGYPAKNGFTCAPCRNQLASDLDQIASLWPESAVTLTRTDKVGIGSAGGSASGERPLPVNLHASEVRDTVGNTIQVWLRDAAGDTIPDDVQSVPQACAWLKRHLADVVLNPEVTVMLEEIAHSAQQIERLVDRHTEKQTAECDLCGKTLTAEMDDWTTACHDCQHVVDIPTQRAEKVLKAYKQQITRAKAVRAAQLVYRVSLTDKTFDRWENRGELKPDIEGKYPAADLLALVEKIVAKRRRVA